MQRKRKGEHIITIFEHPKEGASASVMHLVLASCIISRSDATLCYDSLDQMCR